jgi:hypothetical protein
MAELERKGQSDSWCEFTKLAWELARRAKFELDQKRPDRPIRAVISTVHGDVKAWGRTHTEAMRHLAEGLDDWAEEWCHEPAPVTESVALGPTIMVEADLSNPGRSE